jgi:hypothetical protein
VRAGARARAAAGAPGALAAALLILTLYSAFAHGALSLSDDARIQVVTAALAALAVGGWVWTGTLRFTAPRLALAGVGMLVAFAVWSGVTVLWSVAADQTWTELNRGLTYALVLVLAVFVGASERRAVEVTAKGFLVVSGIVTAYALGQKLVPGLHIDGVFSLNQTGPLPRLQEPLGYWNALALFVAFGVPAALVLAADRTRKQAVRLGALVGVQLMIVTIGFTYSRGGLIALAVALVVTIAVCGRRLSSLMWLAVAGVASGPPLVFGLTNHSLTTADVSLGSREGAGAVLAVVLLASVLALLAGAQRLLEREAHTEIGPELAQRIARGLAVAAGVLVVAGLLAVAVSSRGLPGTVSHAWHSFTATRATSNYDPARLLSADSENRWVWWKEAAGAFSARPVGGWGAGSFGVVHLLYRQDTLSVSQPHSVPLQFLAETGIIGAILGLGAFALLLAAATRFVRRRTLGPERLLAAALLGGAAAYAVHALYDWDWDIPAVTFPALLFLGVLAGAAGRRGAQPGDRPVVRERPPWRPAGPRSGATARILTLGALALGMCAIAFSGVLPNLAASDASSAIVAAAGSSAGSIAHAQSEAVIAGRLDPFSSDGPRIEANIALRRGDPQLARSYLLQAVQRDPSDEAAWHQLVYLDVSLGDVRDALTAALRALQLDPHQPNADGFARSVSVESELYLTRPKDSATAQPLPDR